MKESKKGSPAIVPFEASHAPAVLDVIGDVFREYAMTFEHMGRVANDLAMTKPRLTGSDSDGNPFVVTADQAIQDERDIHKAQLFNVYVLDFKSDGDNSFIVAAAAEGDAKKLLSVISQGDLIALAPTP